jgi:protein-S-isoprenylcysteine O-methyltransferase Ste14
MTIDEVQVLRKWGLGFGVLAGICVCAVSTSQAEAGMPTHEIIEWVGLVLLVTCVLGRFWCSLYISGRKVDELVTVGPYSVSRNPLYFYSILGAAGAGAQFGSILAMGASAALAWGTFYLVALQEERLLAERHGASYAAYYRSVPRFFPNLFIWRDVPTLTVVTARVVRGTIDSMWFLLAIPIAEWVEQLQAQHVLPVLFHLP